MSFAAALGPPAPAHHSPCCWKRLARCGLLERICYANSFAWKATYMGPKHPRVAVTVKHNILHSSSPHLSCSIGRLLPPGTTTNLRMVRTAAACGLMQKAGYCLSTTVNYLQTMDSSNLVSNSNHIAKSECKAYPKPLPANAVTLGFEKYAFDKIVSAWRAEHNSN